MLFHASRQDTNLSPAPSIALSRSSAPYSRLSPVRSSSTLVAWSARRAPSRGRHAAGALSISSLNVFLEGKSCPSEFHSQILGIVNWGRTHSEVALLAHNRQKGGFVRFYKAARAGSWFCVA